MVTFVITLRTNRRLTVEGDYLFATDTSISVRGYKDNEVIAIFPIDVVASAAEESRHKVVA